MEHGTKVPLDAIEAVDNNVLAQLPKGSEVVDIREHGASHWARIARLDTRDDKRNLAAYFLKVARGSRSRLMLLGEFDAIVTINNTVSDFAPRAIAVESYASDSDIWFLLCTFHDLDMNLQADDLTYRLSEMHRKSSSPTGKFGFHTTTCVGTLPQDNRWQGSWEVFFLQNLRNKFRLEDESQGEDQEVNNLREVIVSKVIPRLLRPLETAGRKVKPSLVHEDLWAGNVATDRRTHGSIVFDAACHYAHHEYDLGAWRVPDFRMSQHIERYKQKHEASEPKEDFEDRTLLYSLPYYMHDSILFPRNPKFRKQAVDVMRQLVGKYGDHPTEPSMSSESPNRPGNDER